MSMNRQTRPPRVPTMPRGELVATFASYLEAQQAVDRLADSQFPVQHVTIVGTDLHMVERVTGRLSYSRVAVAGMASGAWFGLFVGVLLWMFTPPAQATIQVPAAIFIGAAFGLLFSVISYAFTGGKRDFTSASQIVATTYSILCVAEHAHRARAVLSDAGIRLRPWVQPESPVPPMAQPTPPAGPATQPQATPTPVAPPAPQPAPGQPGYPPTQPPAPPA